MSKILSYEGIGYQAATFKVDDTTVAALKANYLNASTGRVDVNGKNLGVKLTGDNTVGFGSASAAETDALFGIMVAYEQDGYATILYRGFVEAVEVAAAINLGVKTLAVNNKGEISSVTGADSRAMVTKAATSSDLTVNILL